MKRYLITLLAALALPTAVNAEEIWFECGGDGAMDKSFYNINEETGSVEIGGWNGIIKSNRLIASSDSFLFEFFPDSGFKYEMNISRIDGTYSFKLWMSSYDSDFLEEVSGLNHWKSTIRRENEKKAKARTIFGNKPCSIINQKDFK